MTRSTGLAVVVPFLIRAVQNGIFLIEPRINTKEYGVQKLYGDVTEWSVFLPKNDHFRRCAKYHGRSQRRPF